MNNPQPVQKTLLAVLAHPDDETFGMGGTLALYAARGVAVHLVCATRGEVGEVDAKLLQGFKTVAERRENELRCAAGKLGLAGVHFLGYRDSGMPGSPDNTHPNALAAAPLEKVALEVLHYMYSLKPQVVVTFDPIGGYRHPDHIAIHQATVRAFYLARERVPDPQGVEAYVPQKLYFHTLSRTFLRLALFLIRLSGRDPSRFGRNADIDLASIARVSFPTHAAINYSQVAKLRAEATACHESQGGGQMNRGPSALVRRMSGSRETFMRAFPPFENEPRETDLFAGTQADQESS